MEGAGNKRRQRRLPPTREEVELMLEYKWRLERIKLHKFRESKVYRFFNYFNIACFFIYLEVLFCFFGPADYSRHYSVRHSVTYGSPIETGEFIIQTIEFFGVNGQQYNLVVNRVLELPPQKTSFVIGKDYILRKEIKGGFDPYGYDYRLFRASPIIMLCCLVGGIGLIGFFYDINENPYSLRALTVLNLLTMLGILCI